MASASARSRCSVTTVAAFNSAHNARMTAVRAPYKAALPSRSPFLNFAQFRLHSGRRHSLRSAIVRAQWGADVIFTDAVIVETGKAANNLHRLLIDIGPAVADYKIPGQFIQAKVQEDGKAGFFALASPPHSSSVVELLIKPNGETAEALCAAAAGDAIQVSGVMGKGFPVDRVPAESFQKLYLFATGSGISPIKALIESGAVNAAARQNVVLYYGARTPQDMAYVERLGQWEQDYGVKVVPVYSSSGQGYVQDAFLKNGGVSEGGKGVAAVLCGQKPMAEAITEALTNAGVSKEHILMNF